MAMSRGSRHDPEVNDSIPKARPRQPFTLIELLVVATFFVVLIDLIARSTLPRRCGGPRAQCVNNLKQIGLALHNYNQEHNSLPPAYTVDAKGRPLHSWRTLILPYLDEARVYRSIDLTKPWNDPANAKARETAVAIFHCPKSAGPANTTTYLAATAPNGCFMPTEPRSLADITDAHESTMMVIEGSEESAVPWMAPFDASESSIMGLGPAGQLHHPGGTQACFVDGSVRFLKATISADVLRALISISGNDDPGEL
jgi:prepilin-type processing-associated H-X9-DG protein